ncbi:PASTA domain-containing protein [Liquorilactobacillus mali]
MPDLTEWSRSDVVKLGKLLGINFNIEGSGYVSEQSVAANKSLNGITNITVKLK